MIESFFILVVVDLLFLDVVHFILLSDDDSSSFNNARSVAAVLRDAIFDVLVVAEVDELATQTGIELLVLALLVVVVVLVVVIVVNVLESARLLY